MISAGTGFAPAGGGMTTYYKGLLQALPDVDGIEEVVAFVPPGITHLKRARHDTVRYRECEGLSPNSRTKRVIYEHLRLPRLVAHERADVLLSTHNVRPYGWRGRSVVVLQSLQYFFLPDDIGTLRRAYLRASVPRSLRTAGRVIAVSEASRRDAVRMFDLDPDRSVAVHHGPSPWATEAAATFASEGTPARPPGVDQARPYVVMVSALYEMKNHARLIRAFAAAVGRTGCTHELVIAGREFDITIAALARVAEQAGIAGRVRFLGAYPQEHLPALLANADVVAYPSLYETFGHPVLEAFVFERPLVTSNVAGAAEIAADAALLVDPYDVDSIADGLAGAMTDAELKQTLVSRGRARLQDFSWEKCAHETYAVLAAA
jgi:glycosyltransferase involved in cell wall biosynthesis